MSFEEMEQLCSMFPELDKETIGEILRENGRNMERSVEVLLQFIGDSGGGESDADPPPSFASAAAPPPQRVMPPPTAIPAEETFPAPSQDFLTLGRYMRGGGASGSHAGASVATPHYSSSQLENDEALAIALSRQLQDTLFLGELENNHALRDEIRGAWHGPSSAGVGGVSPARAAGRGTYSGEAAGMPTFEGIFGVSAEVSPLLIASDRHGTVAACRIEIDAVAALYLARCKRNLTVLRRPADQTVFGNEIERDEHTSKGKAEPADRAEPGGQRLPGPLVPGRPQARRAAEGRRDRGAVLGSWRLPLRAPLFPARLSSALTQAGSEPPRPGS